MTDKVYIANLHADKDFTPAEKFGEPIYLTQSFVDLRDIPKLEARLRLYLDKATPSDFVLLTGPSVLIAMIVAIMFERFGFVNVLSWDGAKREYIHNVVSCKPSPPIQIQG